jgi:hypothetical protein
MRTVCMYTCMRVCVSVRGLVCGCGCGCASDLCKCLDTLDVQMSRVSIHSRHDVTDTEAAVVLGIVGKRPTQKKRQHQCARRQRVTVELWV